jgi:transposase
MAAMTARRQLPDEEIAQRYQRGASLKELAHQFDVAVGTIRQRLAEADVPRRRPGAPALEVDGEQLAAVVASTGSVRRAAAELAISRSTARRRLGALCRQV